MYAFLIPPCHHIAAIGASKERSCGCAITALFRNLDRSKLTSVWAIRAYIVFASLLVTNLCFALSEDRKETMKVSAGSADLDQQNHRGVYIDNVTLDQGTTHIRAAKAVTEGNAKNQLIKAIIQGNKEAQAHYWTLTSLKKPPMHAFADTIYYYPVEHRIKLVGNARIEQGADSFSGPNITYDTLHHHVVSKSNGQGPTTIVFHPGKNS